MAESKSIGARWAALALAMAGFLTVVGSLGTWGSCPTTPCGGILMAISEYSGLDLGFGFVTALAGFALTVIGIASFRGLDDARVATAAALFATLIVLMAVASIVWMYVLPGDDKEFYWPPSTAILVGIVGLIGMAASLRLRRKERPTLELGGM